MTGMAERKKKKLISRDSWFRVTPQTGETIYINPRKEASKRQGQENQKRKH